ncbi:hypothetical protein Taro_006565 [Colocasia esculenta]|uniref:Uncharacterized protein n=1 Tax=Colocasia esculenta TaxID=4460 RepID=A0A843U172_COLES|nr:hypothetical protein [Colocasia esculenta]
MGLEMGEDRGAIHPPFAWPDPVGLGPDRPSRARDRRVGSEPQCPFPLDWDWVDQELCSKYQQEGTETHVKN